MAENKLINSSGALTADMLNDAYNRALSSYGHPSNITVSSMYTGISPYTEQFLHLLSKCGNIEAQRILDKNPVIDLSNFLKTTVATSTCGCFGSNNILTIFDDTLSNDFKLELDAQTDNKDTASNK